MKAKIFITVFIAMVVVSCGKPDKIQQLNELKKQQTDINSKIKNIEEELRNEGIDPNAQNAKLVVVEKVQPVTFNHYIEVQGHLDGDENVAISSPMGGNIEAIYVKVGQRVSKDQLMAKLDDKVLVQSKKELKTALEFATELYDKQKALWEQKIGSEVQYLNAKNQKESLEQKLATLNNQIEQMHLKSPINGTVEEVSIKVGQMLVPGMPGIRVVNFNKLKIVANVAESYASKIKTGDKVMVFFPDLDKELTAQITFASKYINTINRTFEVEALIQAQNPALKANMVAMLRINDYSKPNSVIVPINMIQNDNSGDFIYIASIEGKDSVAKKRKIEQGMIYNGMVEVTNGLKSGDQLITAGFLDLEEGEKIKF